MEKIDLLKTARDHCDNCYLSETSDNEDMYKARRYVQELINNRHYLIRLSGVLDVCESCDHTEPKVGNICNELYRDELTRDSDERDKEMKTCKSLVRLAEALSWK